MNDTIPLTMRRLTPEEVLEAFRDCVRIYSGPNIPTTDLVASLTGLSIDFATGTEATSIEH